MRKCVIVGIVVCVMLWIRCSKDNQPPEVMITNPANGSMVNGIVNITAEATDNDEVVVVEFYIDGSYVSAATVEPYTYTWNTLSLLDSSSHSIYAKAYDLADNTGISSTITVMVYNGGDGAGFYESDNFNSYPSSTWDNPPYVMLNGYGNWTSIEWNIMRDENPLDSNYIQLRQYPPGSNNHATYHLTASSNIDSLTVGFEYLKQSNTDFFIYISSDNSTWTDVTSYFGIINTSPTATTSANLTSYIAGYGQNAYIRFKIQSHSGDYWHCAIDDFWTAGSVK